MGLVQTRILIECSRLRIQRSRRALYLEHCWSFCKHLVRLVKSLERVVDSRLVSCEASTCLAVAERVSDIKIDPGHASNRSAPSQLGFCIVTLRWILMPTQGCSQRSEHTDPWARSVCRSDGVGHYGSIIDSCLAHRRLLPRPCHLCKSAPSLRLLLRSLCPLSSA